MASKSLSDALVQRRRRVLKRNTVERNLIIVMAVIRWAWSLASKGADTQLDWWPRGSRLAEWMCYMIWVRATQVPRPSLSIKCTAKTLYYVQTSKDKRAMLIEKNPFSSCSIILLYVHRVKSLLWLLLLSYLLNLTCVRMTEILYKVNYCSSCTLTSVSHVVLPPLATGIRIEHQCTGVNFITAVMSCPNPA